MVPPLHEPEQSAGAGRWAGTSEERFRWLVENTHQYAIILMDLAGLVTDWNRGAASIFGYTAEEVVGQSGSLMFTPDDIEQGVPAQEMAQATVMERAEDERWHVRKDGSRFWGSGLMMALRDGSGQLQGFAKMLRDASDYKQTQEALRLSEEQLQAILDNTLLSVYVKDAQSRYLFVNRGFEEAYGRSRTEIIGRSDQDLTSPVFAEAFRAHDQRILALAEPITLEEDVMSHDGRPLRYLSCKFPLRDTSGQAYAVCGISMDITARKQAAAEREQLLLAAQTAQAAAEAANRTKDEFLAVLSHELRTPLTAMIGWVQLLRSGRLDEVMTKEGFDAIERSMTAQMKLVEDLLDMSRAITGKLTIEARPVEVLPLLEAAVDVMRPAALAKGITLRMPTQPIQATVYGDPHRLQQVLWNLLSNAVKFTGAGGQVEVQVGVVAASVEIAVSDTGQGISPQVLPYVFERFHQGDGSITRSYGGLGLGLAIVRNVIELHGGTVRALSPGAGSGATFIVSLPRLSE